MTTTQTIFDQILASLPDGSTLKVQVGLHWTAVVVAVDGHTRCGLATTLNDADHYHRDQPGIPGAGSLEQRSPLELARLVHSTSPCEVSIGMAAINALLPPLPARWTDLHAEQVIADHGAGRKVVVIGHFPFTPRLRETLDHLSVLELEPHQGDLPASAAPEVIPTADVLAITALTLLNRTFDSIFALRKPGALVLLLGPSTPLTPLLFDHGLHILSGSVVEDIPTVLGGLSQGANFRQLHRLGVRLVSMAASPAAAEPLSQG